jgi:hypothetical protein
MFEMPDDSIAQAKTASREEFVQKNIKRKNLARINMVSNLPTNTASCFQFIDAAIDDLLLSREICLQGSATLVTFPDIVRRRRDYQLSGIAWQPREQFTTIAGEKRDIVLRIPRTSNLKPMGVCEKRGDH